MGILNVTPDSFSDGAKYNQFDKALAHAEYMLAEGADIIDIGGESTRPGAAEVAVAEEIERVVPLIERVKSLGARVSVDTSKPEVMLAAADAGVDMINDVRALQSPGALAAAAACQLPVCLMHMQGQPRTMQANPQYADVVEEVRHFLIERIHACEKAGIASRLLSIDPGFGFGKTLTHNIALLNHLSAFSQLGVPVLAGMSRKSMLGQITGREVHDRMPASLAVALMAMQQGAKIIRVHDVAETADVRKVFIACRKEQ
ncbi:dihydropteroate synthase [Aliikangiella marina]|uniref:dihydropteroate synthase n=2 Tax=Aliikangiella marina TaxID=1712262 RepID=A0A545TEG3_9GAMM|nr:dihydropteroate synthase [Aliikangiella marina]